METSNEIPTKHKCSKCHKDMRVREDKGGCDCDKQHDKCETARNAKKRMSAEEIENVKLDYSYYSYIETKQDKNHK